MENLPKQIKWEVPEFRVPNRGKNWYRIVIILAVLMIFFSFFKMNIWPPSLEYRGSSNNFLFSVIIILSFGIMFLMETREPRMIKVKIDGEGLKIGNKFYDYDSLKNFCVLYKPKESLKNLYFEFKNGARFRVSLPLRSLDPLMVRNFLKRFLNEDLERVSPPLSEQLSKLLKL